MKKLLLKLSATEFRFLQNLLLNFVTHYRYEMPDRIDHQLFIELYQSKFNISMVEGHKVHRMHIPRSTVLALHQYLEGIPLANEAANIRDHLYNILDKYLQDTAVVAGDNSFEE
ncbi:hypothetical protein V6R21_12470 [Limibacter armeniacum]|uniref:hypothetical protein n=1 Tax=Limibacter armeniacum TaxID=466084 RepID=UPI002FE67FFD